MRMAHWSKSHRRAISSLPTGGTKKYAVQDAASSVANKPGPKPPKYALTMMGSTNNISSGRSPNATPSRPRTSSAADTA